MNLMDEAKAVAEIVHYAGGEMTGRVKMQKIAYFLEVAGVGYGFDHEYHHYGPYSESLADAATRARLFDLLTEEKKLTEWGTEYSIYKQDKPIEESELLVDGKDRETRKKLIEKANAFPSVILELAATALFLFNEKNKEPWALTARKKPEKAAHKNNLEDAKDFYRELRAEIETLPDIGEK